MPLFDFEYNGSEAAIPPYLSDNKQLAFQLRWNVIARFSFTSDFRVLPWSWLLHVIVKRLYDGDLLADVRVQHHS